MTALRWLADVLRFRVPVLLICDVRGELVTEVSRRDAAILTAHGRLLCPYGGSLLQVHVPPIGVAS